MPYKQYDTKKLFSINEQFDIDNGFLHTDSLNIEKSYLSSFTALISVNVDTDVVIDLEISMDGINFHSAEQLHLINNKVFLNDYTVRCSHIRFKLSKTSVGNTEFTVLSGIILEL